MAHDEPSLERVWAAFAGYQLTAALKAAVELDVFTHIGAGADSVEALAKACKASPRGLRALLNHLVMDDFLTRDGDRYGLTPTAATFLDRHSPGYIGSGVLFLASAGIVDGFTRLTDAVRRGGTAIPGDGTLAVENPVWVDFARAMGPLAAMTGMLLAQALDVAASPPGKILDLAAGHGMFGIALAQANPGLEVTAVDWRNVLTVAVENAQRAGVAGRFHTIPGSAFDVPFGDGYSMVLLPNFLHHFDAPTCETMLRKCRAALAPGGRVVIVEFVPDDDRSGPPDAVRFGLVMLATTPAGDAYTYAEFDAMLRNAGFAGPIQHQDLLPSPARFLIATR